MAKENNINNSSSTKTKNSSNFEEKICQAIEILSQQALSAGGYDRTILATVIEVIDSSAGTYRLRHQENTFIAKAACPGIEYFQNTQVYVLVPKDDFTNEKIILWSADSEKHLGPLPITSITINTTDQYTVTTREGEEKYIAIYASTVGGGS